MAKKHIVVKRETSLQEERNLMFEGQAFSDSDKLSSAFPTRNTGNNTAVSVGSWNELRIQQDGGTHNTADVSA